MELNEYQHAASKTAQYDCRFYPFLALLEEAQELADKIGKPAKMMRGDYNQKIHDPQFLTILAKELGDCLWQLSQCCTEANLSLEFVAQFNLDKLQDRAERGVIKGDGDNR